MENVNNKAGISETCLIQFTEYGRSSYFLSHFSPQETYQSGMFICAYTFFQPPPAVKYVGKILEQYFFVQNCLFIKKNLPCNFRMTDN